MLLPLYQAVREYLEIKPRVQVLNERCRVFLDLAEILSDSIADSKMTRKYQSETLEQYTDAHRRHHMDHHCADHPIYPRHLLRGHTAIRPPLPVRQAQGGRAGIVAIGAVIHVHA